MDIRKINKLIELLVKSGISEIEIKDGETSVRLSQQINVPPTQHVHHSTNHTMQHVPVSPQPSSSVGTPPTPSESKNPVPSSGHSVRSPMVGTLYSASSPEAKPFVTVGQTINAGDTICIIEAMKMFNEIESDKGGIVKEILVSNGEPVEFDQPLLIIEE